MKDVLDKAGIQITPENKKQVDAILHRLVEVEYKDCSPTWRAIKGEIRVDPESERAFVDRLKAEIAKEGMV
jgi:hypothetical protein